MYETIRVMFSISACDCFRNWRMTFKIGVIHGT